jgi:hypothetical protein
MELNSSNIYYNTDYNDSVMRKLSNDHLDRKTDFVSYNWCRLCLKDLIKIKCPLCNKDCHICNRGCGTIYCQHCKSVINRCSKCNIISPDKNALILKNGKMCCILCSNIVQCQKIF